MNYPRCLVGNHTSSIFPASPNYEIHISTARRNLPIADPDQVSDVLTEHALYSSLFSSALIGTILLRVINRGFTLELISLSSALPPIRYVFPSPILPSPGVILDQHSEVHVLLVTASASLYRIVFPASRTLFHTSPLPHTWCQEHLIKNTGISLQGPVHVQGVTCVLVALKDGGVLRLDMSRTAPHDPLREESWVESVLPYSGSFLTSLTSFLHSSQVPGSSQIISFASHPPPTISDLSVTISRDRVLKIWTLWQGVVASKSLPPAMAADRNARISPSPSLSKVQNLLGPEPRTLVRVIPGDASDSDESVDLRLRILVFMPTPSSPNSGGFFLLYRLSPTKEPILVGQKNCSERSQMWQLRDFMVHNGHLRVLWDDQGKSIVEYTKYDLEDNEDEDEDDGGKASDQEGVPPGWWWDAQYPKEEELTSTHLHDLLSGPGSLADKLVTALLRPGAFSPFTLHSALQQYTAALRSLPGALPFALAEKYDCLSASIAGIVGSTVNVSIDPLTGARLWGQYWGALKRDWEGFIARCRDIERAARWPLALGVLHTGDLIVIERERTSILAIEDSPLEMFRLVSTSAPHGQSSASAILFDIAHTLRSHVHTVDIQQLETLFRSLARQDLSFSYFDVYIDLAERNMLPVESHTASFIATRLGEIEDLDESLREGITVIKAVEEAVKMEEDEELPLMAESNELSSNGQWTKAFAAAYISATLETRYQLCISVMVLLLFVAERSRDDLAQASPSTMDGLFATFRSLAILRFVAHQPAGDPGGTLGGLMEGKLQLSDDDVFAQFGSLRLSPMERDVFRSLAKVPPPTYSLIHHLLPVNPRPFALPDAAHHFFRANGVMQSDSALSATVDEVIFANHLRETGYLDVAREVMTWLPFTPGVVYVLARTLITMGQADEAADMFKVIAVNFGVTDNMHSPDADGLASVIPETLDMDSLCDYYKHVVGLFDKDSINSVTFCKLAIEAAPLAEDTKELWNKVFRGYVALGRFEEAYMALVTTPHFSMRKESVANLVQSMCEDNQVDKLMHFNFAGFPEEVENALSFKARNADPLSRPLYAHVLYAWYIFRGDYRHAAAVMYQRARKISDLIVDPMAFERLAEMQIEAYLVAINCLSLLDVKSAWLTMPVTEDMLQQNRKRRKLSLHIPEDKFNPECRDAEVIELADIRQEYMLVRSRLDLVRRHPDLLRSGGYFLSTGEVVARYVQSGSFDAAFAAARVFEEDMTIAFHHLTAQCLKLTRRGDSALSVEEAAWLRSEKVSAWSGKAAERGWRYLKISLERHDVDRPEYKYRKAVLEKILELDRNMPLPRWLIEFFEATEPEYLIRMCLRFNLVLNALDHSIRMIKTSNEPFTRPPLPKTVSATWLPYALLDQVLAAAEAQKLEDNAISDRLKELRTDISARITRMQKLSQSALN